MTVSLILLFVTTKKLILVSRITSISSMASSLSGAFFICPFHHGLSTLPGILRPSNLFVVEIVHDHRVARFCATVWQLIVYKGTAIFLGQSCCLIFQRVKIASVSPVVDGIIEGNQVGIFLGDVLQNLLLEAAPQI